MKTNSTNAAKYYYYSKDHLGNVRSVVTKDESTNAVTEVQKTHYYPFGGIIADLSTGRSEQNRLYNGKELDTSNNLWWYDYGARQYDPTAPRFTTADPLAEKYYGWNMYMYCVNNPVMLIDPDGMTIVFAEGSTDRYDYTVERTAITGIETKTAKALGELQFGEVTRIGYNGYKSDVPSPISNDLLLTPEILSKIQLWNQE